MWNSFYTAAPPAMTADPTMYAASKGDQLNAYVARPRGTSTMPGNGPLPSGRATYALI